MGHNLAKNWSFEQLFSAYMAKKLPICKKLGSVVLAPATMAVTFHPPIARQKPVYSGTLTIACA